MKQPHLAQVAALPAAQRSGATSWPERSGGHVVNVALPYRNGGGDSVGTEQRSGRNRHQGRRRDVYLCGTHGDMSRALSFRPLCCSVQTQALAVMRARVCPTAMGRAGPRSDWDRRFGRAPHETAKPLKQRPCRSPGTSPL